MEFKEEKGEKSFPSERALKSRSISRRLTVSLIVTVAIVSVIVIASIYFHLAQKAKKELEHKADNVISYLTAILAIPLWDINQDAVEAIGKTISRDKFVTKLTIKGFHTEIGYSVERGGDADVITRSGKILHKGEFIGEVSVSLTKRFYKERNRQLLFSFIVTILIILISLVIVTGVLIRIFLKKPLNSLNEIVNSYASGVYDSTVHRIPYSEFKTFGNVLSQMGEKIREQLEEVREAEAKYRSIFENAIEGIFQSTHAGRFISVNPAMAQILGYDSPEQLTESVTDIAKQVYVDPSKRDEMFRLLGDSDTVLSFEIQLYKRTRAQYGLRSMHEP